MNTRFLKLKHMYIYLLIELGIIDNKDKLYIYYDKFNMLTYLGHIPYGSKFDWYINKINIKLIAFNLRDKK